MTTEHQRMSWEELKASRPNTTEWRAGYERAAKAQELGAQVRALREARGVSQEELARRIGTSQAAIARLELGGAEPRFATLQRIAQALDADLTVTLQPRPVLVGA